MDLKNAMALGPNGLYERRKQAIMLFKRGMTRLEISELVGAHRNTVGKWIKLWKEKGACALP